MNARGRFLTPGRKYLYRGQPIEFVRRIKSPCRQPVNVFIVPEFAGLNGPNDKGLTEFSDHAVRAHIQIISVNQPTTNGGQRDEIRSR